MKALSTAAALLFVLGLAACGDDAQTHTTAADETTTTASSGSDTSETATTTDAPANGTATPSP